MKQIKILYSKKFDFQFRKTPTYIKSTFREAQILFIQDQQHPLLNVHGLKGDYKGCKSFNINADWRVIFVQRKKSVIFMAIGTHKQLYK